MMQTSFLNIPQNVAGALAYLLGPFTGLIFYIGEGVTKNNNRVVKFHALQSTIFFLAMAIIGFVLDIFSIFGLISGLFNLFNLVCWIYLMVSAFGGKEFRIPIIGDVCWEQVNK